MAVKNVNASNINVELFFIGLHSPRPALGFRVTAGAHWNRIGAGIFRINYAIARYSPINNISSNILLKSNPFGISSPEIHFYAENSLGMAFD